LNFFPKFKDFQGLLKDPMNPKFKTGCRVTLVGQLTCTVQTAGFLQVGHRSPREHQSFFKRLP